MAGSFSPKPLAPGFIVGGLGVLVAACGQLVPLGEPLTWVGLLAAAGGLALLYQSQSEELWEPGSRSSPVSSQPREKTPPISEDRLLASTRFEDRFELLDRLGVGHMGEVWRARHRQLGRLCAVKTVRADQVQDIQVRRFLREARVTAGLLSPHTVQVFDFGERRDGSFFYAMELLDGTDLQSLIDETGAMPQERVAHLLIQACHSLEEAHQAGLVHRDLKPANLMVCRYGLDKDFLKIVDFGLAKDNSTPQEAHLTAEKTVLGTAAYLAPESLRGSATVDGRADIYALGCVAYWMLTARLVFEHDVPTKMVRAHMLDDAPRAKDSVSTLTREFDDLIAACLKKSPEARPQSAKEVSERLQGLSLAPKWTQERAAAWWQSRSEAQP